MARRRGDLTVDHLRALRDRLAKAAGNAGAPPFGEIGTYPHDDFIVWRLKWVVLAN